MWDSDYYCPSSLVVLGIKLLCLSVFLFSECSKIHHHPALKWNMIFPLGNDIITWWSVLILLWCPQTNQRSVKMCWIDCETVAGQMPSAERTVLHVARDTSCVDAVDIRLPVWAGSYFKIQTFILRSWPEELRQVPCYPGTIQTISRKKKLRKNDFSYQLTNMLRRILRMN